MKSRLFVARAVSAADGVERVELTARRTNIARITLAAGAVLLLVTLVTIARRSPPFLALNDIAVTELYVLLAAKGQLFVGAYSRFAWHHPGPLYFWMQVPFYLVAIDQTLE